MKKVLTEDSWNIEVLPNGDYLHQYDKSIEIKDNVTYKKKAVAKFTKN